MALSALFAPSANLPKWGIPRSDSPLDAAEELKTIAVPQGRSRRRKTYGAGPFEAEVESFLLHLAAEGKAARTVRTYTEAVRWFAAAHLLRETGKTRWEQVDRRDLQRWSVWLLAEYSTAYASNQFRAVRRFLKWLAIEEGRPDPTAGMRAPVPKPKLVPVFSSVELSALRRASQGRGFADRRDAAIIAVFLATGIRRSELAGIRYLPGDPQRSDVNLAAREIRVRGKAGKPRVVKISYEAARSLDRYLRVRARHPQAARPQLWLGANGRQPLTSNGVYQMVVKRGEECDVDLYPHRFRHDFCHTWLDRGGEGGDLMELNGWSSPQMVQWYGGSASGARARRSYDRIMHDD
jgi:site-specific recombinase XerD